MTFLEENNIVLSRTQRMKDFVKSWALPVICFVVFWLIFKFVLIDYIRDYAKDAIKGCNPDVEGKLNANLFCF